DNVKRVGLIVISSDKGLCGGLNTNAFRVMVGQMKQWEAAGVGIDVTALGNKGLGFMQRLGANVASQLTGLGDAPHMDKLIGPVKVMLDAYLEGRIDALYIVYNRFVNTMKQEPTLTQLLPLVQMEDTEEATLKTHWDYIYEPDAKPVVDEMLMRYIESLVYQGVAENIASEQSARMVAMKAASDNAKDVIGELKLIYNKTRQAAITKELSEIVAGAAAV
ncbi:MAG: ATP synthase F1 subunit gamma, partial [Thiobacillus sp.]|nr:ATP synthase F1 subunit gamma [Thiobacillus sp.]